MGKRQSMFLGDHITISQDGPIIESPSLQSPDSNDDQDMKEVQIETTDPSHLFWVPFHLHPEIAPNEYNKWLSKHGVDSQDSDGIIPSRKTSVSRRKSVLSAQYNPEEDQEEQPSKPTTISEENDNNDFLSGVFSASLELVGQPPMKTRTSIRRSVSLSVSSPTKESFPMDADEESIMAVKRPGGLERGGLSLLRRSARTKIRRNSTASNDIRPDASRLRQTLNANGEYAPVSLVDPGPQPLPSSSQHSGSVSAALVDNAGARKDGDSQPSKRFVSTLRDPSKPTITTYVEPHLLEQQRKENEEEAKREGESSPSFRVSAPGKLEHSAAARLLTETIENDRKERPDNFTVSYPIPPPVKLTQNLLQQQPSSPQSPTPKPLSPSTPSTPSTQLTQPPSKQKNSGQANANGTSTHAKKPSTWSWLWGKEKGSEKAAEPLSTGSNVSSLPSAQTASTEINTQTPPSNEVTVKKQSTLSMLFSRNGKSSSKAHATTAESTQSVTTNSGQLTSSDKPKYSNYNRLPIHIERAIYRLSHVKLANPRRPLQEQVLISNMMFWYLGVIQQQQMLQQQQAEQQQQQQLAQYQKEHSKGSDSKEEGKDSKSKIKPKKRKSQKKKNQQRGSSKSAERIVKSPEYEKQQQYHNNAGVTHVARPRQQGPIQAPENQRRARGNTDQDGQDFSDTYEESGGEDSDSAHQLAKQQIGSQSDTLTTLSIGSPPRSAQEDEEDDDARGPKKHLKRLNAPKHWMLDKLTGTYAPRPTAGPHKLRECLPLIILLRNRL
ncbi:40S ribosomal protein S4, X isoform, partial [Mortierella sp. AD094]